MTPPQTATNGSLKHRGTAENHRPAPDQGALDSHCVQRLALAALGILAVQSLGQLGLAQARFGAVDISKSKTEAVTVIFPAAATLTGIAVRTEGALDLDFIRAQGGTCTVGTAYAKGAACTVNVTFEPRAAGTRNGALVLLDSQGGAASTWLQGTGVGPQTIFLPGTQNSIGDFETTIPVAVAVDGSGDVFVAQTGVNVDQGDFGDVYIEERLPNGGYTQIELPGGAQWSDPVDFGWISPSGIAVDGAGNVYVTDLGNLASGGEITGPPGVYKEILSSGGYRQVAIGGDWNQPEAITVDGAGNVYVYDSGVVIKETLQPDGSYTAGTVVRGLARGGSIAVDGTGNVYVVDLLNLAIYKESPSNGKYVQTKVAGGFTFPVGLAVDGTGNVYILDQGNTPIGGTIAPAIYKETPSHGGYSRSTIVAGNLIAPQGLAIGGRGNLYVADPGDLESSGFAYVWQFDLADPPSLTFKSTALDSTSTDSPQKLEVYNFGNATLNFSGVSYPKDFPQSNKAAGECMESTSLAPGGSCSLTIDFSPITPTAFASQTLTEGVKITTNNLNLKNAVQAVTVDGVVLNTSHKAAATVSLEVSADPSTKGSPLTMTATVEGASGLAAPTGTVAFYSGAAILATSPLKSGGVALFTTSSLAVGNYTITATYSGDSDYYAENSADSITESIVAAPAASISGEANLGEAMVGKSGSAVSFTVKFDTGETLDSIEVLTQGAPAQDFINAGGGTCETGRTYEANATCTVNLAFTPKHPGTRNGAIVLTGEKGNVIGSTILQGTGLGPQTAFMPGTQTSIGSGFYGPWGVAVDGSGNLYVTDSGNPNAFAAPGVYKETLSNGKYIESPIGSGWTYPAGIAVDGAGNVYVCDPGFNDMHIGVFKETLSNGSYTAEPIGTGFGAPLGVAVDGNGNVYVADAGTETSGGTSPAAVYKETLVNGSYAQSIVAAGFLAPVGVAVDGVGNVYVIDHNGNFYKETPEPGGSYRQKLVGNEPGAWGVAVDGEGNPYLTAGAALIRFALQSNGSYTKTAIATGFGAAQGVALDGSGNAYVADAGKSALFKQDFADPPSLVFNKTVMGAVSTDSPRTVTVLNSGNTALRFSAVDYPADFPQSGTAATNCAASTSLDAQGTCSLTIDFKPAEPLNGKSSLAISENVKVTTNTLNTQETGQSVAVSGTEIPAAN